MIASDETRHFLSRSIPWQTCIQKEFSLVMRHSNVIGASGRRKNFAGAILRRAKPLWWHDGLLCRSSAPLNMRLTKTTYTLAFQSRQSACELRTFQNQGEISLSQHHRPQIFPSSVPDFDRMIACPPRQIFTNDHPMFFTLGPTLGGYIQRHRRVTTALLLRR